MAKKKEEEIPDENVTKVGEDVKETELKLPKTSIVDKPVTVISLSPDIYHKDGEEFHMGAATAKVMEEKGFVKIKKEK